MLEKKFLYSYLGDDVLVCCKVGLASVATQDLVPGEVFLVDDTHRKFATLNRLLVRFSPGGLL